MIQIKTTTMLLSILHQDFKVITKTFKNLDIDLIANVDILEELYALRTSLASVVAKLPKPSSSTAKSTIQGNQPWGSLVPSNAQQATVTLKGSTFTVGRNAKCSMCIGDNHIASVLFKIYYTVTPQSNTRY
jgi:hypothetical protein